MDVALTLMLVGIFGPIIILLIDSLRADVRLERMEHLVFSLTAENIILRNDLDEWEGNPRRLLEDGLHKEVKMKQ